MVITLFSKAHGRQWCFKAHYVLPGITAAATIEFTCYVLLQGGKAKQAWLYDAVK